MLKLIDQSLVFNVPFCWDISFIQKMLAVLFLCRKRQAQKGLGSILHDLVESENERDKPPHVILIDQLISFIGSNPQKAVSKCILIYLLSLPTCERL